MLPSFKTAGCITNDRENIWYSLQTLWDVEIDAAVLKGKSECELLLPNSVFNWLQFDVTGLGDMLKKMGYEYSLSGNIKDNFQIIKISWEVKENE